MERRVGTIQSGVLGPYRAACWDRTERRVGTVQSGVLGPYRAACWDHTERRVGTVQSGVLGPYREGFFLSCKANARIKVAKTGHGPRSSKLVVIYVVLLLFVLFYVLFVGYAVAQLVEALRYKSEGRGFDS